MTRAWNRDRVSVRLGGEPHTANIIPHVRIYPGSENQLTKLLEFYENENKTIGEVSKYLSTKTISVRKRTGYGF